MGRADCHGELKWTGAAIDRDVARESDGRRTASLAGNVVQVMAQVRGQVRACLRVSVFHEKTKWFYVYICVARHG